MSGEFTSLFDVLVGLSLMPSEDVTKALQSFMIVGGRHDFLMKVRTRK